MTRLSSLPSTAKRRIGWLVRDRFPSRRVEREVQGVRLVLPWSHRLPDYAIHNPAYGQNLVELARLLAADAPFTMLDVGANVGDSAVQVLNAADGRVLCVEADPFYLDFLHRNVDADARIDVVEALVSPEETVGGTTAVRSGGTTRFAEGGVGDAMPSVTPEKLRAEHPAYADLRLVKSDTDGYDVRLIPSIAEAWTDARPVLFFEYDPYLTRLAGLDPEEVWPRLAALGYQDVAVWDNGARAIGRTTTDAVAAQGRVLDAPANQRNRGRTYWDVAVVHAEDASARAAIERMAPDPMPA